MFFLWFRRTDFYFHLEFDFLIVLQFYQIDCEWVLVYLLNSKLNIIYYRMRYMIVWNWNFRDVVNISGVRRSDQGNWAVKKRFVISSGQQVRESWCNFTLRIDDDFTVASNFSTDQFGKGAPEFSSLDTMHKMDLVVKKRGESVTFKCIARGMISTFSMIWQGQEDSTWLNNQAIRNYESVGPKMARRWNAAMSSKWRDGRSPWIL